MRVLVTGSSGFIGSALVSLLEARGHGVTRLVRRGPGASSSGVFWNPPGGEIDKVGIEGHDAVVNLAGESLAHGRWTQRKKALIRDSRVAATRLLAQALAGLKTPPRVLVSASAIGFYGDRGDEELHEGSSPGQGFLAEVCHAWEQAATPASQAGIRVVHPRFGVVIGRGGALRKMLPPFKLGMGGRFGSGRQYVSWISLDDVATAIWHLIGTDTLKGPVNLVAPLPVTNREFTRTLGRVLHRPALFPLPATAARLALGQVADEMLLASARVLPTRLLETGYLFRFAHLEDALKHALESS